MIDGSNSAIVIAKKLYLDVYEVIKFLNVLEFNDLVGIVE